MNDLGEILQAHEPQPTYTESGLNFEGFECAYCTPRQLLTFPMHTWDDVAEHLARVITEAGATS